MPHSLGGLKAPASFQYRQFIRGYPPPDVFAVAERWAAAERAKVHVSQPPFYLQVNHGTKAQMLAWKPNARKVIRFRFTPVPEGTLVDVEVALSAFYTGDVGTTGTHGRARVAFDELLSGLWAQMGAGPTVSAAEAEHLTKRGSLQAKAMVFGGIIMLAFAAMAWYALSVTASPAPLTTGMGWLALSGTMLLGMGLFSWKASTARTGKGKA